MKEDKQAFGVIVAAPTSLNEFFSYPIISRLVSIVSPDISLNIIINMHTPWTVKKGTRRQIQEQPSSKHPGVRCTQNNVANWWDATFLI